MSLQIEAQKPKIDYANIINGGTGFLPITKTPTLETLSKTGPKTKIANLPELQTLKLVDDKLIIGGAITIQVF